MFLGIDGMDPTVTTALMARGELPALKRLSEGGSFAPLPTMNPALSPVVWTSMATGVNPGAHGVFDFIHVTTDYKLSVSLFEQGLTGLKNPVQSPTFWETASAKGIESVVLRWPVSFPPKEFSGRALAGLGVPDLLGTQGTYTLFTDSRKRDAVKMKGRLVPAQFAGANFAAAVPGPWLGVFKRGRQSTVPLRAKRVTETLELEVGKHQFTLAPGQWSPWIELEFDVGFFRAMRGQVRFFLSSLNPELSLYMTPIHPGADVMEMRVSHPASYAGELQSKIGAFATIGLPEDTNAFGDGVLDEKAFLEMTDAIFDERLAMLRYELGRFKQGILACVFDTLDRVQHMFWGNEEVLARYYRKVDAVVAEVLQQLDVGAGSKDRIIIASDHGFTSFEHEVHLNAWLHSEGFLTLNNGATHSPGLYENVDWSKTKAFAMGFTGIRLNVRGREKQGLVDSHELATLKQQIRKRLLDFMVDGKRAVEEVYDGADLYHGPGATAAPDLVVGYRRGFRGSWQTAVGGFPAGSIVTPNLKKWHADHCCDPSCVPGVVFLSHSAETKIVNVTGITRAILGEFGI